MPNIPAEKDEKFKRCVKHVKAQGGNVNPYAVCYKSVVSSERLERKEMKLMESFKKEELKRDVRRLEEQLKDNPIENNPANMLRHTKKVVSKNLPEDEQYDEEKKKLVGDIEELEERFKESVEDELKSINVKLDNLIEKDEEVHERMDMKEYLHDKKEFTGQLRDVRIYVKNPAEVPRMKDENERKKSTKREL